MSRRGISPYLIFALGKQLVWLSDQARGRIELKVRQRAGVRAPVQTITHGSWELTHLRFDERHLIYPSSDGLMVFDLDSRKSRRIAGTADGDLPVAWGAQSRMLAWSSPRPCAGATANTTSTRPYLCIASLPPF